MVRYNDRDMRSYLQDTLHSESDLDSVYHDDFLVYVMGPYTTIDLRYFFDTEDNDVEQEDISKYDIDIGVFDHDQEMYDVLEDARDYIRKRTETNAFIATNAKIPRESTDYSDRDIPEERPLMDAVGQSKQLGAAANCVLYIFPFGGLRDGVGMELGSVLEYCIEKLGQDKRRFRVLREEGVKSTTINDSEIHYEVPFRKFATKDEYHAGLRQEVNDVFTKEQAGKIDGNP